MSDIEVNILHEKVLKFYRIFNSVMTLGFVLPKIHPDLFLRRLVVPICVILGEMMCIYTVFTTTDEVPMFYCLVYCGALYQSLIKYYVLFIGHQDDFQDLLNYMETLTKDSALPMADAIRRKNLKISIGIAFMCIKPYLIILFVSSTLMALFGFFKTKCCVMFCHIPDFILSSEQLFYIPANLLFGNITFYIMAEIISFSDSVFILILAYFEAELSSLREIIETLDAETLFESPEEVLKFIYEAHRNVLLNLRIFREIYWHLNLHVIITIFSYMCLLLFMSRFYEASLATYAGASSAAFQLFLICFFGQILRNRTEAIGEALYLTKWYQMPLKEQKALLIIMAPAQQAVGLEAGGIMDLSFRTFGRVMRAAVSYGAILYTILNE
ncbi:hypothetical protein DMENIID0001_055070 [Sergentomyia squamirostris]